MATTRMLKIGGHRIAYRSGNPHAPGTPLIFLHGIAGSVDFWPAMLPANVRAQRRWYSIGLPGHYPSQLPDDYRAGDMSSEIFSAVVHDAIRTLVPNRPVGIVGYSAGGFAALNVAAREPELVSAVLSISGFGYARLHGMRRYLQMLLLLGRGCRWLTEAACGAVARHAWPYKRATLANAAGKVTPLTPFAEEVLDICARNARSLNIGAVMDVCSALSRCNIFPQFADIRAATMIVAGDRDPIVRYDQSQNMAARIPHAELVTLNDVGHIFYAECREGYERICSDWLKRYCPAECRKVA